VTYHQNLTMLESNYLNSRIYPVMVERSSNVWTLFDVKDFYRRSDTPRWIWRCPIFRTGLYCYL